ncbi:AAA family ATPase [Bittarella massiliensis (ex Durand et al. 2017)]|uniref:AAA family ATPase n=1 Tax=Bittarella massiliensis (ex Durand et al. 2017) TaxID=1720313 RepID=UPI001AA1C247|nr:MoxR family ATPase [Bittarella massiliensis (ex Durand et al. 2017)]MBO1680141.1 MoxR family ATPase [Bittarella massiliensis (ex Durand et al. 2017)]
MNRDYVYKSQDIVNEVKKAVIGKDDVVTKVMLAVLARGHVLLEDIPGVGKTTLAVAFSKAMNLDYNRVQFTPDVMPSDVTGFSIYDKEKQEFVYKPGAAMCNLFLADEINRTSSKTQSALLEVMEEGSITVDGVTRQTPRPFVVIATENPIGSVGTQLLPESQLDRFAVCLTMGYPDAESELNILRDRKGHNPLEDIEPIASGEEIMAMQNEVDEVHVHDDIYRYITEIAAATRSHPDLRLGLSPRGTLAVAKMARANAYYLGREYVVPDDVRAVLKATAGHRVLLTSKAGVAGLTGGDILEKILGEIEPPSIQQPTRPRRDR